MMDYMPYSSDMDQQQAGQVQHSSGSKSSVFIKLAIFLVIVVLGAGGSYFIATAFPDKVKDLLIAVDRFGITEVGATEQKRVRTINRLEGITFEERQVLIRRTVFLGASREMVYLALGEPVCILQTPRTQQQAASEAWVYYIEGDRKPTQLVFQNNELLNAGKTSALDACK